MVAAEVRTLSASQKENVQSDSVVFPSLGSVSFVADPLNRLALT